MVLTLRVLAGEVDPPLELHCDAPRIVVGRSSGCELQLPDPSVSRLHAIVEQRGTGYVVLDQSSDSGTFSFAERLGPKAAHALTEGELLRFGRVWVEVGLSAPAASEASASRELARRMVEWGLRDELRASGLRVRCNDEQPALTLGAAGVDHCIGSHADADLRLADAGMPERIAQLRRQGDQLWVTRLCDEPLELDGQPLPMGERVPWPRQSPLLCGPARLTWDDPTGAMLARLERAPCEKLSDHEPIDPPVGREDPAAHAPPAARTRRAAAKAPRKPKTRTRSHEPTPTRGGRRDFALNAGPERWTGGDATIFLLALGVLVASIWAIQWIARLGTA